MKGDGELSSSSPVERIFRETGRFERDSGSRLFISLNSSQKYISEKNWKGKCLGLLMKYFEKTPRGRSMISCGDLVAGLLLSPVLNGSH